MVMHVVGVGADGWESLAQRSRLLVADAEVLIGGTRHLNLVPAEAAPTAKRVSWPSPLRDALPGLLAEHAGQRVVVLASGDPLVSGIGTTLIELLGPEAVEIHPALSSVALARARMRWPAESVTTVSLVGRDTALLARHVLPGARLIVLVSSADAGERVAELLVAAGHPEARLTVLTQLDGPSESRIETRASDRQPATPALSVIAVECAGSRGYGVGAGLPDDAFEHDGQLTKRDLRAAALARLAPAPGELLWDVGAGAGSVGIEWARSHPRCRCVAVEREPARAERISRNATRLGVPGVVVVHGSAPEALEDLEAPDAIFVGGGADAVTLARCWDALRVGGRLVVHAVTVETEALLVERFKQYGGELTRHAIEHAEPLGRFTGWRPARAVTQWAGTR